MFIQKPCACLKPTRPVGLPLSKSKTWSLGLQRLTSARFKSSWMASRQTDPTCGPDHSSTPKSTPPQDRIDLSSAGAAKLLNFGPDRRAWPALDLADLRADFLRFADLGADLRLTIKPRRRVASRLMSGMWILRS